MDNEVKKLDMQSKNIVNDNLAYIQERFPSAVVETKKGYEVDFDILKQELSNIIVDDKKEKYQLTWPGKKEAILQANTPINKTLRPLREKSVDFKNTENIYIEGDNLEALKILQESYLNKIKCIYIDPPYNTGNNLIYKNNYFKNQNKELMDSGYIDDDELKLTANLESNGRFHSDWLSMIYPRLKLARNLLKDDGIIIIAIDDSELINVTKVCDEIYGEKNRLGIVTVIHKPEGRNQAKYFATSNEYAIFYAKNADNFTFENVILDTDTLKEFEYEDEKGKYKLISAIAKNHGREGYDKNLKINNPKNAYPLYVSTDLKRISLTPKCDDDYCVYPNTSTQERTWRYIKESMASKLEHGEFVALQEKNEIKIFEKYRIDKGQLIKTHWIDKKYNANTSGTKILDDLMKVKTFDFPKSLYLMIDIIKLCSKDGDIILDFFSGSATTAHAILEINKEINGNRKFVLVQILENTEKDSEAYKNGYNTICDIGEERIRRAAKEIKKETNADIDYGFRVYKIDSSNMKDVYYVPTELQQSQLNVFETNIKENRTADDLLTQVILDLGLTLDLKIEEKEICNNKIYFVSGNSLVACFDDTIDINIIDEICKVNPLKIVFKENSFKTDNDKINVFERIKKLSPETEINII